MKTIAPVLCVLVTAGCAPTALEDFRSAAPSNQGVEVAMSSGGTKKQGLNDLKPALMPGVTLLTTVVVNGGVGLTLGTVASIVAQEPTVLAENHAEWGPHTEPLWKHSFRLTMDREEKSRTVTYVLERRPKSSTAEADYEAVVTGTHLFDTLRAGHGDFVLFDLDAKTRAEVTYSRNEKKDTDVKVAFRGGVSSDYAFTQVQGGEGSFEFVVESNVVTKTAANERLAVKSRWMNDGTGRADVIAEGADLDTELSFSECWNSDLNRTFYVDSLGLFPTEGEAKACAFDVASYSRL